MTRAKTIEQLISLMQDMQERLDAAGDECRHWHGVYRRGTIAVSEEIGRGGFLDPVWLERWDLVFADVYLDAMEQWDRGDRPAGPWQVAFEATRDPAVPPLRHVLLGLNAHVNFDLPQALIGVISDEEFDDPDVMVRGFRDHKHVDDVLVVRIAGEDREIAAAERPGTAARSTACSSRSTGPDPGGSSRKPGRRCTRTPGGSASPGARAPRPWRGASPSSRTSAGPGWRTCERPGRCSSS